MTGISSISCCLHLSFFVSLPPSVPLRRSPGQQLRWAWWPVPRALWHCSGCRLSIPIFLILSFLPSFSPWVYRTSLCLWDNVLSPSVFNHSMYQEYSILESSSSPCGLGPPTAPPMTYPLMGPWATSCPIPWLSHCPVSSTSVTFLLTLQAHSSRGFSHCHSCPPRIEVLPNFRDSGLGVRPGFQNPVLKSSLIYDCNQKSSYIERWLKLIYWISCFRFQVNNLIIACFIGSA